jgi:hypothetical protein
MKTVSSLLSLIVVMVGLSRASFAATQYVITNDNQPWSNTATVFELNTATGSMKEVAALQTGGEGAGNFADFGNIEQAITANRSCVFVVDADSEDIASFSKASSYSKVGNYTNGSVAFGAIGGSIALSPNGKFLYASYGDSENIGAWQVNPDCSLTFIAAYVPSGGPDVYSAIKVTPNGAYLVVPIPDIRAELFGIQQSGTLTDIGYLELCPLRDCIPVGVDITRDSKLAVFGGSVGGGPAAFTVEITPAGLTNFKGFSLANPYSLKQNTAPFLSADAYAGSGNVYFGFSGHPSGVVTANFTEKPTKITPINSTLITPPGCCDGSIAVTGNIMFVAEYPNVVGVFLINSDGSLSSLSSTTVESATGLISVSLFPATR